MFDIDYMGNFFVRLAFPNMKIYFLFIRFCGPYNVISPPGKEVMFKLKFISTEKTTVNLALLEKILGIILGQKRRK